MFVQEGADRRRHPRTFERRKIKLRFADCATVFADSLDHSKGGLRLSHPPHFRPRLNDEFAVYDGKAMIEHEKAVVIAITPAGIHLRFAA